MSNDATFSILAAADTERSVTAPFSGSTQTLGSILAVNPILMVFDNESTVAVQVYVNSILWKTFAAGSALVLDMKANHGIASTWTFPLNTQFNIVATGGTGSFNLSILYGG